MNLNSLSFSLLSVAVLSSILSLLISSLPVPISRLFTPSATPRERGSKNKLPIGRKSLDSSCDAGPAATGPNLDILL